MATVFVTYKSNGEKFRFDRDYYESVHLPLCRKVWEKYGLVSSTGVYPKDEGDIVAVAVSEFRDQEAAVTAFGSPEGKEVMNDVVRYTDLTPSMLLGASFSG
ncbi:EthD family reductase [Streptomyces sp. H23]|uniref:EthD family reductase n=1 Tax=Streptomyces TaxID=1883 RepID=UPI00106EAE84|nr:EthD family reductase [Streptomyces sp. H23]